MPFGAFVEILPGKEGLVHISELANYRVPTVEDVVKIGDEVQVLVTEIDRQGRVNLSRRALLEPAENGHEDGENVGRGGDDGADQGDRPRSFSERRGRDGDRGGRGGGGGYRDRDRGPRPASSTTGAARSAHRGVTPTDHVVRRPADAPACAARQKAPRPRRK